MKIQDEGAYIKRVSGLVDPNIELDDDLSHRCE